MPFSVKRLIVNQSDEPTPLGWALFGLTMITGCMLMLYPAKLIIVGGLWTASLPPKIGMAMCWTFPDGEWCSDYQREKERESTKIG